MSAHATSRRQGRRATAFRRLTGLIISLGLVTMIGLADYRTGPHLSFSIFYLIPIAMGALVGGRLAGMVVSLACAVAWLAAEMACMQQVIPRPAHWVPYWNAGVRLGFFLCMSILLSAWQRARAGLQEVLDARTAALSRTIARQKRTEQELAESEERFRQAQKMEAIGRLAGGLAHDIRNQMTVVNGYCQIELANLKEQEPLRESLEEIHRAGQRVSKLTTQLLAFSRREILKPQVVSLNRLLGELQGPLAQMIGEDIQLSLIASEAVGNADIDVVLFHQAIMNLAVNARDAMPSGGRLTIETANVDLSAQYAASHPDVKPGPHVMVAVSDTGCGMDEQVKAHIFEPFFTTKPAGQGTGLGLSMVYGFVRQSGGHIGVYSEKGSGTTFRLYFPRVQRPQGAELPARQGPHPRGTETVLVVEDDRAIRQLAAAVLGNFGYKALTAAGPRQALEMAQENGQPIQLLLTDVVMPELNGPELARRLSAARAGLKVLYMTGYAESAIVQHGLVEPGVNIITKPFGPDELIQAVRRVLDAG